MASLNFRLFIVQQKYKLVNTDLLTGNLSMILTANFNCLNRALINSPNSSAIFDSFWYHFKNYSLTVKHFC